MDARFYNSDEIDIQRLANDLENIYRAQNYQVQQIGNKDQVLVQLKKGGDFEAIIGMQAALSLTIQRSTGGVMAMIGQQRWIDKAAVGAVGIVALPVLWPLAITAGVGAVRQASLGNQVLNVVDGLVRQQQPGVQVGPVPVQLVPQAQQQWAPPQSYPSPNSRSYVPPYVPPSQQPQQPVPNYVPQPQPVPAYTPPPAPAPAPAPKQLRCPNCNTPYEQGDTFCTGCGRSLAEPKILCPSCNTEIKANEAFCPKCGASTYKARTQAATAQAPRTPPPVQPQPTYTTPAYTPPAAPPKPTYTPPKPKVEPYVPSQPQQPLVPPKPTVTFIPAPPSQEAASAPTLPQEPPMIPYTPPAPTLPASAAVRPHTPPPPPRPIAAQPSKEPAFDPHAVWGTLIFNDGKELQLSGERDVVGRYDSDVGGAHPEVDLASMQASDTVSRVHAVLEHVGSGYTLTDLNSTNATRINGKRLDPDKATPIADGDTLHFGKITCTFKKM